MLPRGRLKRDAVLLTQRIRLQRDLVHAESRQLTADLRDALRSPFALPIAFAIGLVVPRLHPWPLVALATRLTARGLAVLRLYRLFQRGFASAIQRAH